MTNALASESSPYLRQHAHNPVDWLPWGEQALARARREDKPLLVSIGYSSCHWCHVMERESFEDRGTAELMNERFVCVKVDREERPDIDALYMEAVQSMTGHGGWPLNVFLTPDQIPFYAGTYFPPEQHGGMPSWRRVLEAVARAWDENRDEIRQGGDRIVGGSGGNIVIGGYSSLDPRGDALLAILAEWQRTDETYQQRIDHIRGTTAGGLNGGFFFNSSTVFNDFAPDTLTGGPGLDWFWANLPQDTITDLQVGELIN